jgi:ankyrin repeat protein
MEDLGQQLWCACSEEDPAEAARLLDAGANKDWRGTTGGFTPIIHAALYGRLATVKLLADRGVDKSARDSMGVNALMWAGNHGRSEVAAFLLDRGVDIHARDNNGYDALWWAATFGRIDTCLLLIERKADARTRDNNNRTALTDFGFLAFSRLSRLSDEEKQQGQQQLIAAWLAGPHPSQVAQRHWNRRRSAMMFLVGCKLQPTAAQKAAQKAAQALVDTYAKLPGVPRRTKEENWNYLQTAVFGHPGLARKILGWL